MIQLWFSYIIDLIRRLCRYYKRNLIAHHMVNNTNLTSAAFHLWSPHLQLFGVNLKFVALYPFQPSCASLGRARRCKQSKNAQVLIWNLDLLKLGLIAWQWSCTTRKQQGVCLIPDSHIQTRKWCHGYQQTFSLRNVNKDWYPQYKPDLGLESFDFNSDSDSRETAERVSAAFACASDEF